MFTSKNVFSVLCFCFCICLFSCLKQPLPAAETSKNVVLASLVTEKGGNVPRGFENAGDLRVFVDGRVQMIGSKRSLTNLISDKHLKSFPDIEPDWVTGDHITTSKLDALRKAIDSTNFDQLKINKDAPRPSSEDAADRVAVFQKGNQRIVIQLWQVSNMSLLEPVLSRLADCGIAGFGEARKNSKAGPS